MVGLGPYPLSGVASSREGVREKGGSIVWEMSLWIYRSSIRLISSGRFKSRTKQIKPLLLPGFPT